MNAVYQSKFIHLYPGNEPGNEIQNFNRKAVSADIIFLIEEDEDFADMKEYEFVPGFSESGVNFCE